MRLNLYPHIVALRLFPCQLRFIHIDFQIHDLLCHFIKGMVQDIDFTVCILLLKTYIQIPPAELLHDTAQLIQRAKHRLHLVADIPGQKKQTEGYGYQ